jgi:hypothetical protein
MHKSSSIQKWLKIIFYLLGVFFLLILLQMFVPFFQNIMQGPVFLVPFIIFAVLGAILFRLTLITKLQKKQKMFFLICSISATGVFISIFLHNFFYAISTILENIAFLALTATALEILFFFVAIIICPIAFIIGYIGSIVLLLKQN